MPPQACPVCLQGAARPIRSAQAYECPDCGAAFRLPEPSPAPVDLASAFRGYWDDYHKGRALAPRLGGWRTSGDFLDVGCALGAVPAGLRDHSGWRVRGLEASARAAELGRALNGVDIAGAPLSQAPYPPESFDHILLDRVLEREPAPRAVLAGAADLLRPGGRLEIVVSSAPGRGGLIAFSRRSLLRLLADFKLRVLALRRCPAGLAEPPRGEPPAGEGPTLEQGRALIGPEPSWPLYVWGERLRRLAGVWLGRGFEVLAEKP